jgi:hypothetical protein
MKETYHLYGNFLCTALEEGYANCTTVFCGYLCIVIPQLMICVQPVLIMPNFSSLTSRALLRGTMHNSHMMDFKCHIYSRMVWDEE